MNRNSKNSQICCYYIGTNCPIALCSFGRRRGVDSVHRQRATHLWWSQLVTVKHWAGSGGGGGGSDFSIINGWSDTLDEEVGDAVSFWASRFETELDSSFLFRLMQRWSRDVRFGSFLRSSFCGRLHHHGRQSDPTRSALLKASDCCFFLKFKLYRRLCAPVQVYI